VLENYSTTNEGVIYQVRREPFCYDKKYVTAYNRLDCRHMSELRLQNIESIVDAFCDSPRANRRILDVGYGNGSFLEVAHEAGYQTFGYDVTDVEPPIGTSRVSSIHDSEYDIVTFFDSLEHTPSVDTEIAGLKAKFVVISLPWFREGQDYSDDWFKQYKHRKPNEHLWHFSSKSLVLFMLKHNYIPLQINNCEDKIRKGFAGHPNILTGVFRKL